MSLGKWYEASVALLFAVCSGLVLLLATMPPRANRPAIHNGGLRVRDMAGVDHVFTGPPQRIVFASQIIPAYLTLAGDASDIVGATDVSLRELPRGFFDRMYPSVAAIPSVGNHTLPDFEAIARRTPQVVVAWPGQAERLQGRGLFDVVTVNNANFPGRSPIWRLLANITDHRSEADALSNSYSATMAALKESLAPVLTPPVRVLILVSGADRLWISGRNSLDEYLVSVGARNVAQHGLSGKFSLEDIAWLDPDVILIQSFVGTGSPADLFTEPRWRMMRAVQKRNVFRVPDLPTGVPPVFDPLLLQWLAEVLHPSVTLPDFRSALRQTYARVYRYDLTAAELDDLLAVSANEASSGYSRFAAPGGPPTL